ncbi:MAG: twin-arginine translocation signal domain-containing protein, partial [Chloroflexi bacterium]|nr:twin-arginine translocation signal domain-containing protein [Chloroflexota bacterium]
MTHPNRREFLKLTAGAASVAVLSACGGSIAAPPSSNPAAAASAAKPAPSAPTSVAASAAASSARPAASAVTSGAAKGSGALPAFMANSTGPKPDFPAAGPLYEDGFATYPKNAVRSVTAPPGSGGKMLAFAMNGTTIPPTPKDQNPAWQAVNKALNTDVDFVIITQADYQAKLATMMAGNDLADTIEIQGNVPNLAAFLNQAAADLTPYLAGDAAKDYPNLAAIPTFSWQNSGCVQNGRLVMVPVERYYPGNTFLRNVNMYDKEIGANYVPKDAEDWKRVLTQLNKPSAGRYATGSYNGGIFGLALYAAMFGAPNNWSLGSDGKLVKDAETPQ